MERYAEASVMASPPVQNGQGEAHRTDEQALRDLLNALFDRWAAGDAEGYAALFTEDADYVAFDGVNQKGRQAIIAAHQPLFTRWLQGSRLVGQITDMRLLAPDVALLHASGDMILAGKSGPAPARASIQTLVAVKRDGEWRFTAFHNGRIRPIGVGLGSVVAWALADLAWRIFGPKA
jgi:uncharacterized protein (TIGR02246 family)